MLFSSLEFIFYFFVPLYLLFLFFRDEHKIWYVIFISILFYGISSVDDLLLLLCSIVGNYLFAIYIEREKRYKKYLLFINISLNILVLSYFKYYFSIYQDVLHQSIPLAISFFTFQQIAYVVDVYRGIVKRESFERYLFFILFFPQLVAGPIVGYNYLMSQIESKSFVKIDQDMVKKGLYLFSIGVFKKVVLADGLLYSYTAGSSLESVFAYGFYIYFDFSGYSDMALGLAMFFGVKLPINFNSPYKATNLVEFWRRWHITLSEFLKNYIYIPLGGNRYGKSRQVFALLVTMALGGIWHGGGWNFLLWGVLHGVGLVVVHLFSKSVKLPKLISTLITFLYVMLLWGLFKSTSISEAVKLYQSIFEFGSDPKVWYMLFCSLVIVWFLPNSNDIINKRWFGYVAGVLFFVSLMMMVESPAKSFVYFKF